MPTLPNMNLVTPTQGGDSGTWDDKINAALALIDAHDHTSGKGAQVPVSGLNVNADLPMGGFALTSVGQVAFTAVAELAAGSKVLFVNTDDNELYWRTSSGTNVKLTSGTTINASLIGGIAGDYSSVGAELAYVDADEAYTFKNEATPTKQWVRASCSTVRLHEHASTESVYVELSAPAALGASYTVTWPTAVPGVQSLVQMSTSGVVSLGGSGIDHDVVLASGRSFEVAGGGVYKHDGLSVFCPCLPSLASVSAGTVNSTGGQPKAQLAISTSAYFPILAAIPDNATIISISISADANIGAGATFTLYEGAFGAFSPTGETVSGSGASATATMTMSAGGLPMTGVKPLWIRVETDGATTVNVGHFEIFYTVE